MNGEQEHSTPEEPRVTYTYDPDDPIANALHDLWAFLRNALHHADPGERLTFVSNVAVVVVGTVAATIYGCQLHEMRVATGAAKSAADTAKETLWYTEGANIVTKKPTFDIVSHHALMPFRNEGHITSGPAVITAHEATFTADPQTGVSGTAIEAQWVTGPVDFIPTAEPDNAGVIDVPALTLEGLMKGTQIVTIAGEIDYAIGIPDAPQRAWLFCYTTHFNWIAKKSEVVACMPSRTISVLKTVEQYPKNGVHY